MAKNVKLSTRDTDVMLDWAQAQTLNTGTCYLVALQDWHIAVLLSLLRYAEWVTRWRNAPANFQTVRDAIAELEGCLMAGCNVDLLISTLSDGFDQIHEDMQALNASLQTVATNQGSGEDLEDDLANLWRQVEQIAVVLGTTVAEAPIPL